APANPARYPGATPRRCRAGCRRPARRPCPLAPAPGSTAGARAPAASPAPDSAATGRSRRRAPARQTARIGSAAADRVLPHDETPRRPPAPYPVAAAPAPDHPPNTTAQTQSATPPTAPASRARDAVSNRRSLYLLHRYTARRNVTARVRAPAVHARAQAVQVLRI